VQWRIATELKECPGIAWVRRALAGFDWSKADWITARRVKGRIRETRRGTKFEPLSGVCKLPRTSTVAELNTGYRINTRISRFCGFPVTIRSGRVLQDESETFVWLIAHEAAHYLFPTDQLSGEDTESECDSYADEMLSKYRAEK